MSEAPCQPKPLRSRRATVFALLTIVVAGLWAWGTYVAAEQVREYNAGRLWTSMMAPGAIGTLFGRADPVALAEYKQAQHGVAYVEGAIRYWERAMYGVAGFLALVGTLSLVTRAARPLHLLAAIVMPVGAAATLVTLQMLYDPDRGAMPPLSAWTSVIAVSAQSIYALILLVAFVHRPRRQTRPGP